MENYTGVIRLPFYVYLIWILWVYFSLENILLFPDTVRFMSRIHGEKYVEKDGTLSLQGPKGSHWWTTRRFAGIYKDRRGPPCRWSIWTYFFRFPMLRFNIDTMDVTYLILRVLVTMLCEICWFPIFSPNTMILTILGSYSWITSEFAWYQNIMYYWFLSTCLYSVSPFSSFLHIRYVFDRWCSGFVDLCGHFPSSWATTPLISIKILKERGLVLWTGEPPKKEHPTWTIESWLVTKDPDNS